MARTRKHGSTRPHQAQEKGKALAKPQNPKQDIIVTSHGEDSNDSYGSKSFHEALVGKGVNIPLFDSVRKPRPKVERVISFSQEDQSVMEWL